MVHVSIFGGHEGELAPGRAFYVSIFGGSTLRRPAFATRLMQIKRYADEALKTQYFFFSLFGGAEVKWPTLAEEYLALTEALRSGGLTLEDWDRHSDRMGLAAALQTGSFSLFGGSNTEKLPSEDEELDDLSRQRHAGAIGQDAAERLMLGIGQHNLQRLAAVRQAVAAALQPAS